MSYFQFSTPGEGINEFLNYFQDDIQNNVEVTAKPRCEKRPKNKVKQYECPHCAVVLLNASNLSSHIRTHTGEKPFKCKTCGFSFTQQSNLKSHLRTHSGIKPFACKVCGKSFARASHLTGHQKLHTGQMTHQCEMCTKKFYTNTRLKKHRKEKHENGSFYFCGICDEYFLFESALRVHSLSHSGDRPFRCNVCSASLRSKEDLNIHLKLHKDPNPKYQCPKCGKIFQIKLCCQLHHSTCNSTLDIEPVPDPLAPQGNIVVSCDKSLLFETPLPQPDSSHDDGRSFKCTVCSVSFRSKEDLNIHTRLHSNATSKYQCSKCGQLFQIKLCCELHYSTCTSNLDIGTMVAPLSQGNIIVSSEPLDATATSNEIVIHVGEEAQAAAMDDQLICFLDPQEFIVPSDLEVFDLPYKSDHDGELIFSDVSDPLNINALYTTDENVTLNNTLADAFLIA